MNISICTGSHEHSLTGWKNINIKTFQEIELAIKNDSYAAFGEMKGGYKKAENIVSMSSVAMFDIDNDPDTEHLTMSDAVQMLNKCITFAIVTSRSHQKQKDGKPAVDRFRIIVPLNKGLTANKESYRVEMTLLAEKLGLLNYVDHKALKDIARFYYKSPSNAKFISNNTKNAFNVDEIISAACAEIADLEKLKQKARDEIRNRIVPGVISEFNTSEFHKIIDIDSMNQLPLDEIYETYTSNRLVQEGSYLMGKGITEETSGKRRSFTILNSDDGWIWHEFKTGESGNVLSFMRYAAGLNAFQAAQELEKKFNVNILIDNPLYYSAALQKSLDTAINDKTLIAEMKKITGANFIKIEKNGIRIADKEFSFDELEFNKVQMIDRLRANREEQGVRSSFIRN